jgi:hypothetical protein
MHQPSEEPAKLQLKPRYALVFKRRALVRDNDDPTFTFTCLRGQVCYASNILVFGAALLFRGVSGGSYDVDPAAVKVFKRGR